MVEWSVSWPHLGRVSVRPQPVGSRNSQGTHTTCNALWVPQGEAEAQEGPAEHLRLLPHTDHVLAHLTPSCSGCTLGQAAVAPGLSQRCWAGKTASLTTARHQQARMGLPPFLAGRSTRSLRRCWSPGRYPSAPGELADHLLPPAQTGCWGLRDCVSPQL